MVWNPNLPATPRGDTPTADEVKLAIKGRDGKPEEGVNGMLGDALAALSDPAPPYVDTSNPLTKLEVLTADAINWLQSNTTNPLVYQTIEREVRSGAITAGEAQAEARARFLLRSAAGRAEACIRGTTRGNALLRDIDALFQNLTPETNVTGPLTAIIFASGSLAFIDKDRVLLRSILADRVVNLLGTPGEASFTSPAVRQNILGIFSESGMSGGSNIRTLTGRLWPDTAARHRTATAQAAPTPTIPPLPTPQPAQRTAQGNTRTAAGPNQAQNGAPNSAPQPQAQPSQAPQQAPRQPTVTELEQQRALNELLRQRNQVVATWQATQSEWRKYSDEEFNAQRDPAERITPDQHQLIIELNDARIAAGRAPLPVTTSRARIEREIGIRDAYIKDYPRGTYAGLYGMAGQPGRAYDTYAAAWTTAQQQEATPSSETRGSITVTPAPEEQAEDNQLEAETAEDEPSQPIIESPSIADQQDKAWRNRLAVLMLPLDAINEGRKKRHPGQMLTEELLQALRPLNQARYDAGMEPFDATSTSLADLENEVGAYRYHLRQTGSRDTGRADYASFYANYDAKMERYNGWIHGYASDGHEDVGDTDLPDATSSDHQGAAGQEENSTSDEIPMSTDDERKTVPSSTVVWNLNMLAERLHELLVEESWGGNAGSTIIDAQHVMAAGANGYVDPNTGALLAFGNIQDISEHVRARGRQFTMRIATLPKNGVYVVRQCFFQDEVTPAAREAIEETIRRYNSYAENAVVRGRGPNTPLQSL